MVGEVKTKPRLQRVGLIRPHHTHFGRIPLEGPFRYQNEAAKSVF